VKLHLCIVSATPELFWDAARHAVENARGQVSIFGFGNGCELSWDDAVDLWEDRPGLMGYTESAEVNHGVPHALHRLWASVREHASGPEDVLCYIHDDLRILEPGWDTRVLNAFRHDPRCGLAGFGGATALGGDEIYKRPYEVHQLGRRDFFSNMVGAEHHGKRVTTEMPIVFTDGQSMIVKRELLDKIDGWSWWPFHLVHHAYDYGIACMARRHGYSAWLVPCHVEHRGGLTACGPKYHELAAKHGGDAAVHAASHRFVYDTFRDVLPLRLK
jgi:GT2 family glycosyltransferase